MAKLLNLIPLPWPFKELIARMTGMCREYPWPIDLVILIILICALVHPSAFQWNVGWRHFWRFMPQVCLPLRKKRGRNGYFWRSACAQPAFEWTLRNVESKTLLFMKRHPGKLQSRIEKLQVLILIRGSCLLGVRCLSVKSRRWCCKEGTHVLEYRRSRKWLAGWLAWKTPDNNQAEHSR